MASGKCTTAGWMKSAHRKSLFMPPSYMDGRCLTHIGLRIRSAKTLQTRIMGTICRLLECPPKNFSRNEIHNVWELRRAQAYFL